jgi:uncharacterized membrane protein YgdD (TMEM256/DUF423 family)
MEASMTARWCLLSAAIALALAVGMGAFGAHALKARLGAEALAVYQTAVQYHFGHALGLLVVGLLWQQHPQWTLLGWVAGLLLGGIVLFAGSLYALALTGMRALGAITPIGAAAFIAAWLLLAYIVWRE